MIDFSRAEEHAPQLQSLCGRLLNQPLVSPEKLKDLVCLLSEITSCLNWPSQSYFTQIFNKFRRQTPQRAKQASVYRKFVMPI